MKRLIIAVFAVLLGLSDLVVDAPFATSVQPGLRDNTQTGEGPALGIPTPNNHNAGAPYIPAAIDQLMETTQPRLGAMDPFSAAPSVLGTNLTAAAALTDVVSGTSFCWYPNPSGGHHSRPGSNPNGSNPTPPFDIPDADGEGPHVDDGNGPWPIPPSDPNLIKTDDPPWNTLEPSDGDGPGDTIDITPVPLPGAVLLGIIGLSCAGWRLKRETV